MMRFLKASLLVARSRWMWALISLGVLSGRPAAVAAQPVPPAQHPQLCGGSTLEGGRELWGSRSTPCPEGFAVLGVDPTGGAVDRPGRGVPIKSTCCPLPSSDVLVGEPVAVLERCPDGYVSIGAAGPAACDGCDAQMVCRKVNSDRYQLGAESRGVYWGFGSTYWQQQRRYMRRDIPAGLRFALGRIDRFRWLVHGCVGEPFGSLLVAKTGKRCGQWLFRALEYRGLRGDPPEGTPVTMFPPCDSLKDIYARVPECAGSHPPGSSPAS